MKTTKTIQRLRHAIKIQVDLHVYLFRYTTHVICIIS